MTKGSSQEGDIVIINLHAPNTEAPQHIRQMLRAIKGEKIRDFNNHLHQLSDTQTESQ